jgi:hypothetical protein
LLQNKTLEELKRMGKQQLETQLDMLEILFSLPNAEQEDFGNWYMSHPYYKGFYDVVDIVRRRAQEANGAATFTSDNGDRSVRRIQRN